MTEQEIRKAEERAGKATAGPWVTREPNGNRVYQRDELVDCICTCQVPNCPNCVTDADFIAHAREDIPKLCEEVRELKQEVTRLIKSRRKVERCEKDWMG